jgi:ethanolamine kinase
MTWPLVSSITLSFSSLSTDIFPLITLLRPDWSPSNTFLQQFTGGINNTTFGLFDSSDPTEALVIKLFGNKTEEFIDRDAELHTLHTLSQHELAQPILLQFTNGVIYKFVPGEICTRDGIRDIKIAPLIAQKMAELHTIHIEDKNQKPCLVPLMRKFLALMDNNNGHPEGT